VGVQGSVAVLQEDPATRVLAGQCTDNFLATDGLIHPAFHKTGTWEGVRIVWPSLTGARLDEYGHLACPEREGKRGPA